MKFRCVCPGFQCCAKSNSPYYPLSRLNRCARCDFGERFENLKICMIGTIRRHQQWLWILVIAATIISFTAYLSPSAPQWRRQGPFLGKVQTTRDWACSTASRSRREQNALAEREGLLFYRLHYGQWPTTAEQKKIVDSWAKQRLFLDAEMKQLNINVTPEAAARFTKQMLGLRPDQAMPKDKFEDFVVNELGRKGGLTLDDFNRFVVHQAGQEYLVALFGMSGKLITSQEAEFFYRRENSPMVTEIINFPMSNYYAFTKPNQQELEDYYTKHAGRLSAAGPHSGQLYCVRGLEFYRARRQDARHQYR